MMAVVPGRCTIVSMDRVAASHTHCVLAAPAPYSKRGRVVVAAGAARKELEHPVGGKGPPKGCNRCRASMPALPVANFCL